MTASRLLKIMFPKPSTGGVLVFLLTLPGMLLLARMLAFLLPDALYYPLTFYSGFLEFTPLLLLVPVCGWSIAHHLAGWIADRNKTVRIILRIILFGLVVGITFIGGGVVMWMPGRFDVGHPYCRSDLLQQVDRCEGIDRGFLQDRISAVAMLGAPVSDLEKAIETYPDYQFYETACADLAGGFGARCYTGQYLRSTGDTNFSNIYSGSGKTLVLISENIPLGKIDDHSEYLKDFVNLDRFKRDF